MNDHFPASFKRISSHIISWEVGRPLPTVEAKEKCTEYSIVHRWRPSGMKIFKMEKWFHDTPLRTYVFLRVTLLSFSAPWQHRRTCSRDYMLKNEVHFIPNRKTFEDFGAVFAVGRRQRCGAMVGLFEQLYLQFPPFRSPCSTRTPRSGSSAV